jgi:hypothetical protein
VSYLILAGLLALASPSPEPSPAYPVRHLEYRFGWNAAVADTGPYTGTLKVDLQLPTTDGSVPVAATETWWNALRPSATDNCQIYPDGGISCLQRPYSLSATDLALFPLLSSKYFDGLGAGKSTWQKAFQLTRGLSVWDCAFTLNDKGTIPGSGLRLIVATGTIAPHGDRYGEEAVSVTARIAYDPVGKLPVLVNQEMLHNHNQPRGLETVQLKLLNSPPSS